MSIDIDSIVLKEFPQQEGLIYLNHAGVAPWPRRTAEAVQRFAEENATKGPVNYSQWLQVEAALRAQLRQLINAPAADDIALLKNTSEGLSVIAYGLSWNKGDNIVISDQEFPSNRIVWESLKDQGVEVRQAELDSAETPEDALFSCVDKNTRLLAISSVQYATGLRMDVERIGAFCRDNQILYCIDAIQSLGALSLDVQRCHADFVVADGHKWMLGPEGIALFYCRAEIRDQLSLKQYGWHMIEQHNDYDRKEWEIAKSARRFECGSPNMLGIHGLQASLSLLLEIGIEEIEQRVLNNTKILIAAIKNNNDLALLSNDKKDRLSGIVSFRHQSQTADEVNQNLRANGVICAIRNRSIRFSAHFYISSKLIKRVVLG